MKIEPVTVRQWIRRGKLRSATNFGGEWRIPAITDPPTRGYSPVRYYNNGRLLVIPEEIGVTLNQNPCVIDISKSKDGDGYLVYFDHVQAFFPNNLISEKTREKLELTLISNPNITNSYSLVGRWPRIKEGERLVSVMRCGDMRLPKDWDENLF